MAQLLSRPSGAADRFFLEVRGGQALRRKLRALADKDMKAIMRKAMRAGAKVLLPVAKANAPVITGQLRRAIKVRAAKRSRRYVGITVTLGEGFFKGDEFYGAFQEFGWHAGKRLKRKKGIAERTLNAFGFSSASTVGSGNFVPGLHFLEKTARSRGKAAGDVVVASAHRQLKVRALLGGGLGGGRA